MSVTKPSHHPNAFLEFFISVARIINLKTVIITILSIVAMWFCLKYDYYADFPLTLVGIAVVFPVVFSINSAYNRRELALSKLAECKGFMLGIYRTSVDFLDDKQDNEEIKQVVRDRITNLFAVVKKFFESDISDASEHEIEIYRMIRDISKQSKTLQQHGMASRIVSRLSQYLTEFSAAFENMKVIFYYRTAKGIRAYSRIFIYAFPVLYAPYFAWLSQKYAPDLPSFLYYVMPFTYSFILVSLANIQDQLENPYDQIGEDDITIDLDEVDHMLQK